MVNDGLHQCAIHNGAYFRSHSTVLARVTTSGQLNQPAVIAYFLTIQNKKKTFPGAHITILVLQLNYTKGQTLLA